MLAHIAEEGVGPTADLIAVITMAYVDYPDEHKVVEIRGRRNTGLVLYVAKGDKQKLILFF